MLLYNKKINDVLPIIIILYLSEFRRHFFFTELNIIVLATSSKIIIIIMMNRLRRLLACWKVEGYIGTTIRHSIKIRINLLCCLVVVVFFSFANFDFFEARKAQQQVRTSKSCLGKRT